MNLRNVLCAAAGVLALASAGAASAAVSELNFGAPGAQPQIYFTGFVPGTTTVDPHLSATLDLKLTSVGAGGYQWNFSYDLANTSTTASRIATIGWDIAPDFLSVVGVGGVFGTAASGNMAALGAKEFCLKDGGGSNNCAGGGNGGLTMGQSGSGTFSLTFLDHITTYTTVQTPRYNSHGKLVGYTQTQIPVITSVAAPTSVAFDNFGMHMQSLVGGLSTGAIPGTRSHLDDIRNAVPEPATWAMLILGFGVSGAMLRRRRALPA